MIQTMGDGSSGEPVEILTTASDLVPTSSRDRAEAVDWPTAMKRAIRCSTRLRRMLGLSGPQGTHQEPNPDPAVSFPTFVPLEFVRRIRPGDPHDPLLRQVLVSPAESNRGEGYCADPVGDLRSLAAGGLIHKYDGRALVITSGACGVHCRYCFRREFPYGEAGSRRDDWRPALDYLAAHGEIDEVILSGGDPLTLTDDKLFELIKRIEGIDHVRRLRFHTRMPIVIPQRVTPSLIERLRGTRLATWFVVHVNHPNELDADVLERLGCLRDAGIPLLNQAVLLRGVNDDADTLIELSRILVNHRIEPYYLHQLDRVTGAAHFEVPVAEGRRLMDQMRTALPGYAVPRYVVEQSGERSKTSLST